MAHGLLLKYPTGPKKRPDGSTRDMPTSETEIELLARAMIDRHGAEAPQAAIARLNLMIDRSDWAGRDRWACVVHAIHECQGTGPVFADRGRSAPRVAQVA
jgi:hypothetical protein